MINISNLGDDGLNQGKVVRRGLLPTLTGRGAPFPAQIFKILSRSLGKEGEPMTSCIWDYPQRSVTCIVPLGLELTLAQPSEGLSIFL